jgi:hypothetical protein
MFQLRIAEEIRFGLEQARGFSICRSFRGIRSRAPALKLFNTGGNPEFHGGFRRQFREGTFV